jgi:hypothetical protein
MSVPLIHGKRRTISASCILTALADALSRIRAEDRLTWDDMGRVIGKSPDQAAKYADASAEMGAIAFAFARKEWGARFTGELDMLLRHSAGEEDARAAETEILRCALTLSGLLADGELSVEEIRANRSILETARDRIDGQLARVETAR